MHGLAVKEAKNQYGVPDRGDHHRQFPIQPHIGVGRQGQMASQISHKVTVGGREGRGC